ncbi:MAG TPA: carboxypeptidase-like regulatory domain-containing protein [Bacteroidia bacterium]|nr:carboxypeptidase-like regulatory domain-containing protein [Bacteroidia bacterium]
MIKGTVVEKDSSTVMPFVYIINKSNGNGTMSDNDGNFFLGTSDKDTLVCSYVGYAKLYIPVKQLAANTKGEVKIVMKRMSFDLNEVTVSTFRIKPYERQYMNDIIDKSRIKTMDYAMSPISALYMRYSKEGKQISKLAKIFEDIMIEEQVQKKLSREILVRLTKDENIDYDGFRKYCYYVNNYYIVEHDGVELYTKVMECYRRWKADNGVRKGQNGQYKAGETKDPHRAREAEGEYHAH